MNIVVNGKSFEVEIVDEKASDKSLLFRIRGLDKAGYIYRIKDGYSSAAKCKCKDNNNPPFDKAFVDRVVKELGLLNKYGTFSFDEYIGKNPIQIQQTQAPVVQTIAYIPTKTNITVTGGVSMVSVVDRATGNIAMFTSYEDAVKYSIGKTVDINTTEVPFNTNTPVVDNTSKINSTTAPPIVPVDNTSKELTLLDDEDDFDFTKSYEELQKDNEPKPKTKTKKSPMRR